MASSDRAGGGRNILFFIFFLGDLSKVYKKIKRPPSHFGRGGDPHPIINGDYPYSHIYSYIYIYIIIYIAIYNYI